MYLISFDCKFKTNRENMENIFQHYGLRKIQSSLYVGDLNNYERKDMAIRINESIKEKDSVLIIPLCQSCFSKKESCGQKIKFKNDLFRVY